MYDFLTQQVLTIGRLHNQTVEMLGTGFFVERGKYIVVPRHVVGDSDINLGFIAPNMHFFNTYQDTTVNACRFLDVTIEKSDPFRDIAILKPVHPISGTLLDSFATLSNADSISVGEDIFIVGYPHCVEGRRVLTLQKAMIGAKILLDSRGIKSKYFVINTQTRPGQSGSMIYDSKSNSIIGMLIGAFAPSSGISLGGINPRELHQTTQCVSAEYISQMIGE